jgi:hypothetical protein
MFLTFNSEEKPFPFNDWPSVDTTAGYSVNSADDSEAEDIVDGEYVEAEEVVDDDIPSFTAEESEADDEKDQPLK